MKKGLFENLQNFAKETGVEENLFHLAVNETGAEQESGLMLFGSTPIDNAKIGEYIEQSGYHAEWTSEAGQQGYWFFPEDESTFDQLEKELTQELELRNINFRIEGVFAKSSEIDELLKPEEGYDHAAAEREYFDKQSIEFDPNLDKYAMELVMDSQDLANLQANIDNFCDRKGLFNPEERAELLTRATALLQQHSGAVQTETRDILHVEAEDTKIGISDEERENIIDSLPIVDGPEFAKTYGELYAKLKDLEHSKGPFLYAQYGASSADNVEEFKDAWEANGYNDTNKVDEPDSIILIYKDKTGLRVSAWPESEEDIEEAYEESNEVDFAAKLKTVLPKYQKHLLKALTDRRKNQESEEAHDEVLSYIRAILKELGASEEMLNFPWMEQEFTTGESKANEAFRGFVDMLIDMNSEGDLTEGHSLQSPSDQTTGWSVAEGEELEEGSLDELSKVANDYISQKISKLSDEGRPHKQAIAIAYSMADKKGYKTEEGIQEDTEDNVENLYRSSKANGMKHHDIVVKLANQFHKTEDEILDMVIDALNEDGEDQSAIKNVTDNIIKDVDGSFWVDALDPDTSAVIIAPNDRITFQDDDGHSYTGTVTQETNGIDDDVYKVKLDFQAGPQVDETSENGAMDQEFDHTNDVEAAKADLLASASGKFLKGNLIQDKGSNQVAIATGKEQSVLLQVVGYDQPMEELQGSTKDFNKKTKIWPWEEEESTSMAESLEQTKKLID